MRDQAGTRKELCSVTARVGEAGRAAHSRRTWGPLGPGAPLLLISTCADLFFPGPREPQLSVSILKQLPLISQMKKRPRFISLDQSFSSRKSSKLNIGSLFNKRYGSGELAVLKIGDPNPPQSWRKNTRACLRILNTPVPRTQSLVLRGSRAHEF